MFKDLRSPIEIGPSENFPLAPERFQNSGGDGIRQQAAGDREQGAGSRSHASKSAALIYLQVLGPHA